MTHSFIRTDTIAPVVTPASISDILETDIKAKNVAIEGLVESLDSSTVDFVLVCGYGRVGKMICDLLDRKFIRYIAIESNSVRAEDAKSKGLPVFYADINQPGRSVNPLLLSTYSLAHPRNIQYIQCQQCKGVRAYLRGHGHH